MKFTIEKNKAKKMLKLLKLNSYDFSKSYPKLTSYVVMKSVHGKIISSQASYNKSSSPPYKPILNFYRYAEFDSEYFKEISYDTSSTHIFKVDNNKLLGCVRITKADTLQFEYPNPETGGLKVLAPPSIEMNFVAHRIERDDIVDIPFKRDGDAVVIRDDIKLDRCVVVRKKEIQRNLIPKIFEYLRFIVDENEITVVQETGTGEETPLSSFKPPCIIKKCVKPVNNLYMNRSFLKILQKLGSNPTIYLTQDYFTWITNDMKDYRIGFLIPTLR